MSYRLIVKQVILFALVLLWVYAAASKLLDFNMFRAQMHRQVLPHFLSGSLPYILPEIELAAALMLLFDRTQFAAFCISLVLMIAFTIYIGGAVFRFYDRIPCSCGGVLSGMGWDGHFIFNIFFLLLTAVGFTITYRERRPAKKI